MTNFLRKYGFSPIGVVVWLTFVGAISLAASWSYHHYHAPSPSFVVNAEPAPAPVVSRPEVEEIVGSNQTPEEVSKAHEALISRIETDKIAFAQTVASTKIIAEKLQSSVLMADVKKKAATADAAKTAYTTTPDSLDAKSLHLLAESYLTAAVALDRSWKLLIGENVYELSTAVDNYSSAYLKLKADLMRAQGDDKAEIEKLSSPLGEFLVTYGDVQDARYTAAILYTELHELRDDGPLSDREAADRQERLRPVVERLERAARLAKMEAIYNHGG